MNTDNGANKIETKIVKYYSVDLSPIERCFVSNSPTKVVTPLPPRVGPPRKSQTWAPVVLSGNDRRKCATGPTSITCLLLFHNVDIHFRATGSASASTRSGFTTVGETSMPRKERNAALAWPVSLTCFCSRVTNGICNRHSACLHGNARHDSRAK